jgi:hypothetical protein
VGGLASSSSTFTDWKPGLNTSLLPFSSEIFVASSFWWGVKSERAALQMERLDLSAE